MGRPRERFNIVLVGRPAQAMITNAFLDVAALLQVSLEGLGRACAISRNVFRPDACNIVLGHHLLDGPEAMAGLDCIVYQLEQLPGQDQPWLAFDDRTAALLGAARTVWDFSVLNLDFLAARGFGRARHLPIGFHPRMERIEPAAPDIDVLFYGAVNLRRKTVLDALGLHCRVKAVAGVYGARRDALIARSSIVLNLRSFSGASIMEQPRVAYLLNNRRFVVTEDARDNPYGDAVAACAYQDLVDRCRSYLDDEDARRTMAERGHAFLRARPMAERLAALIDEDQNGLSA